MSTIERDELDGKQTILYFGDVWVRVKDARRIVDDLKRQLEAVTRERDRYRQAFVKALSCVDQAFQPHSKPEAILPEFCRLGEDKFEAVPKLATAYKEAREQLAAVQAEAAAMRKNVHEVVKEFRKLEAMEGNEPIRCSRIDFGDWADRLLEPTAGRELLDEMRRKDERIAELEKRSAEWETWYLDMQDRAKRKCRTAKAALVEARERIAELEAQIRDGVKAAYDAAEKAFDAKEWADDQPTPEPAYWALPEDRQVTWRSIDGQRIEVSVDGDGWERAFAYDSVSQIDKALPRCNADGSPIVKPEPVWQYRRWNNETPGYGVAIWRTSNGSAIESSFIGQEKRYWSTSSGFSSWRECVDNPNTFPCDESGERIDSQVAVAMSKTTLTSDDVAKINDALSRGEARLAFEFKPVEQADEPLKVGDWVELRSKPGDECYETRTLQLSKLTWPRQITTIDDYGYVKPHGYDQWCNPQRFRRVPATSADAPLVAIARELRELLTAEHVKLSMTGLKVCLSSRIVGLLIKLRDAEGGA